MAEAEKDDLLADIRAADAALIRDDAELWDQRVALNPRACDDAHPVTPAWITVSLTDCDAVIFVAVRRTARHG